jgi:hypothetical protein
MMIVNSRLLHNSICWIILLSTSNHNVAGFTAIGFSSLTTWQSKNELLQLTTIKATNDDAIDPLEGSGDSLNRNGIPARKIRKLDYPSTSKLEDGVKSTTKRNKSSKSESKDKKGFTSTDALTINPTNKNVKFSNDGLTLDQRILLKQAEILRTLPLDFFMSYRGICEQIVPRFGLYTLTFHVILLIPLLRIVKFQLDQSIFPFLYIGPALFLVPFVFFFLWENDITEVKIFDRRLLRYVQQQKNAATETLRKDRNELMKVAATTNDLGVIKKIADLSLMSTIDVDNLISEIISIKKRIKGRSGNNPILSTFTPDVSSIPKNGKSSDDINKIGQTLVETSLLGDNGDEKSLLEKLKELQKGLDKI